MAMHRVLAGVWLGVRNLAMIVLFPGTVTLYIPYRLLEPLVVPAPSDWALQQYAAVIVVALGVAVLLASVWSFASIGKGTLAPFDETKQLVVVGLYRNVRNPMYVGVTTILLGESWFFWSRRMLIYTGIVFAFFNLFIILYEENRLRHKYGDAYRRYCRQVGRWLPGRPYEE